MKRCPACKTAVNAEEAGSWIGGFPRPALPSASLCNDCFDILHDVLLVLFARPDGLISATAPEEKIAVKVTIRCAQEYEAAERLGADPETLTKIIADTGAALGAPPRAKLDHGVGWRRLTPRGRS